MGRTIPHWLNERGVVLTKLYRLSPRHTLAAALATMFLAACSAPSGTPGAASSSAEDTAQIRQFLKHVEDVFDAGDLDAAVDVFADDAMILGQGAPDAIGKAAIRDVYQAALAQANLKVRFHTEEIYTLGDLAYERGTYTLTISDKATGQPVSTVTNRHIHILKRQPDGEWKTWRMMTNSPEPAPGG